jgi:tRNA (guanine37-N1)-methyltransferase
MMRFDVFSLMPDVMVPYLKASVLGRAQVDGLLDVHLYDIRDYATDRHRTTDDVPYGGGGGMVMKPEPIFAAVEDVLGEALGVTPVILLSPQGRPLAQKKASALAHHPRLALIAGRYEGVDERVREHLATDEVSVGDFVLTGGELPALMVIDAVARWLPGVLGDASAAESDSFAGGLLEHPHYTRPGDFRGWPVPDILRSGDHAAIARWRRHQSLWRTFDRRPDLIASADLSEDDQAYLTELAEEAGSTKPSPDKRVGG